MMVIGPAGKGQTDGNDNWIRRREGCSLRATRISSDAALRRLAVRRYDMTLGTILLIVLVLLLIGAIPTWPHSRGWGYTPSGAIGLVFIVLLVLFLMGRI